jgi:hypothetical protein
MQYHIQSQLVLRLALVAASLPLLGTAFAASAESVESAVWKERKVQLHYYGYTTAYTCDGLEDKVKQILVTFGARKDAKVSASGCENGSYAPSRSAWIAATFHTLQPGAPGDKEAPVMAKWATVELAPRRPLSMGAGECEVVDVLRKTITANFALRDTDFRARCWSGQVNLTDYHVKTQALIAQ